jgi:hypothetical protein
MASREDDLEETIFATNRKRIHEDMRRKDIMNLVKLREDTYLDIDSGQLWGVIDIEYDRFLGDYGYDD